MATFIPNVTLHEHCQVAPALGCDVVEQSVIPLTFIDVFWIYFHPIQRLLFYRFKCTNDFFRETLVPNLKMSLAKSLKHYLPIAGKLFIPQFSGTPEIRYVAGDSVSFTVAESSEDFDFDYWTGNQARDADAFYGFVPHLPTPEMDTDSVFKTGPLISLQVTLIPGNGICVGISNHHTIGDASSIVRFIKCWSSLARIGEDASDVFLAKNDLLPTLDRSIIHDPSSHRLNIFWSQLRPLADLFSYPTLPTNNFRETFILHKSDIQKLRNSVSAKRPWLTHLSSFTILTAYVWSCMAKCAEKTGEEVDENEPEYFLMAVDARHRLDPPVPLTYFGNCLAFVGTESTFGQLKGGEGFCIGVELLGELISKQVNNKNEIMKGADDWLTRFGPLFSKRILGVAGSPNFDLYDTDFGWGKPNKFESISIDGDASISLCKSREFEGGLEIGLSLPVAKLEVFATIFNKGLEEFSC